MNIEKIKIITPKELGEDQLPFVNEECGDSMWDAVLEESEKKNPGDPSKKKSREKRIAH